ncbi:PEP-CTERM sorting domain-containing protein [Altererythrobacter halimionae]|uniref:PEP-CTERM sorting domain-containing protein n=1 Tax=Alteriqipengyuania halimionae TaxID=1926630 RepID=A0A6I4U0U3_9SPHN|nr:PEP-CTERM sorting domain-containing protein [Alteriqipengyuania halimionae]
MPEPSMLGLFGLAAIGAGAAHTRRRRRKDDE